MTRRTARHKARGEKDVVLGAKWSRGERVCPLQDPASLTPRALATLLGFNAQPGRRWCERKCG